MMKKNKNLFSVFFCFFSMDQRRALQIASIENARKQLQLDREKREQQLKRKRERERLRQEKKQKITENHEKPLEDHKEIPPEPNPVTEMVLNETIPNTEQVPTPSPAAMETQRDEKEPIPPSPPKEMIRPPRPPVVFKPFLLESRFPKKPHLPPLPMRPSPYLESSDSEEDEEPNFPSNSNLSPKPSGVKNLNLQSVPSQKNPFLKPNVPAEAPKSISPIPDQTPTNIPSPIDPPPKAFTFSLPDAQTIKTKGVEVAWNAGRYITYMAFAVGIAALRSVMQRRLQQDVENALEYNLNAVQGPRIPATQGEPIPPPPMDTRHTFSVVPIGY